MKKVNVLISDFQYLTREGLVHLIEHDPGLELQGLVDQPEDLLSKTLESNPGVLILDYKRHDAEILAILKKILDSKTTNVLVITNDDEKEHIQVLLDLGIKGIVTKRCSKSEIVGAIHSISRNNRFYCNRILDLLMDQKEADKEENCDPTSLSPREYEVLKLITKGYKTAEIADKLFVSVHTINSHRKNILKKLNLKSPTELIVYAIETGLVKI